MDANAVLLIIAGLFGNLVGIIITYSKLAQRLARVETHIVHIMQDNGMIIKAENKPCEV